MDCGHILPHISYASPVWDGCANDHLKKSNSLQRRAAKLILCKEDSYTGAKIEKLGFLPIEKQFSFGFRILDLHLNFFLV